VDSPLALTPLQAKIVWHRRYNQDEGKRSLRAGIVELFAD
jgi:hypothetical protein